MNLRHSYAVHRLEQDVSLPQLQQELGHASIRTTERYKRCLAPQLPHHTIAEIRKRTARHIPLAYLTSRFLCALCDLGVQTPIFG